MAQLGFNADDYHHTDEFAPLPAGEYLTMITQSSLDNTRAGGQMVRLTYTVMEGPFQGRKLWSRHNIINSNPKAEEIGRREISRIAHAVGQPRINDTEQLLQKVVRIAVVLTSDPGYGENNAVKKWFNAAGQVEPPLPVDNPTPARQAADSATTPPWG